MVTWSVHLDRRGAARFLTVSKVGVGSQGESRVARLGLVRHSRLQVHGLLQRFPVTAAERQELQPRTERAQFNEGQSLSSFSLSLCCSAPMSRVTGLSRELSRAATGRLSAGLAQVPPAPSEPPAAATQALPVYRMKEAILKTIAEHRVSMVAGETGSGKTTQVQHFSELSHLGSLDL